MRNRPASIYCPSSRTRRVKKTRLLFIGFLIYRAEKTAPKKVDDNATNFVFCAFQHPFPPASCCAVKDIKSRCNSLLRLSSAAVCRVFIDHIVRRDCVSQADISLFWLLHFLLAAQWFMVFKKKCKMIVCPSRVYFFFVFVKFIGSFFIFFKGRPIHFTTYSFIVNKYPMARTVFFFFRVKFCITAFISKLLILCENRVISFAWSSPTVKIRLYHNFL